MENKSFDFIKQIFYFLSMTFVIIVLIFILREVFYIEGVMLSIEKTNDEKCVIDKAYHVDQEKEEYF